MENLSQVVSWFALLPIWIPGLALAVALAGVVLVRRWRNRAQASPLAAGPALWPAEIPTYHHALPLLRGEIARVRRNGRSLAVMVLGPVNGQHASSPSGLLPRGDNGKASATGQPMAFVVALMGAIVRDALRECDIVAYDAVANHYLVLLPDSDEEKARQAARRLGELIASRMAVDIKVGIATFPGDGLILQALVNRANAACNNGTSRGSRVDMTLRSRASIRER